MWGMNFANALEGCQSCHILGRHDWRAVGFELRAKTVSNQRNTVHLLSSVHTVYKWTQANVAAKDNVVLHVEISEQKRDGQKGRWEIPGTLRWATWCVLLLERQDGRQCLGEATTKTKSRDTNTWTDIKKKRKSARLYIHSVQQEHLTAYRSPFAMKQARYRLVYTHWTYIINKWHVLIRRTAQCNCNISRTDHRRMRCRTEAY